ncbi:unnamed protein product [Lepidochelys kempii]
MQCRRLGLAYSLVGLGLLIGQVSLHAASPLLMALQWLHVCSSTVPENSRARINSAAVAFHPVPSLHRASWLPPAQCDTGKRRAVSARSRILADLEQGFFSQDRLLPVTATGKGTDAWTVGPVLTPPTYMVIDRRDYATILSKLKKLQ